jgi:hypothetical protein
MDIIGHLHMLVILFPGKASQEPIKEEEEATQPRANLNILKGEKNLSALPQIKPKFLNHPAHSLVPIPTMLS